MAEGRETQMISKEETIKQLQEIVDEITDKKIVDDVSIPEQFWPIMQYDPADDVVASVSCLICGTYIPLRRYESGPGICSECKEAVLAMRKALKNNAEDKHETD